MDLKFAGYFVSSFPALNRFQGDFGLKLGIVLFAFNAHRCFFSCSLQRFYHLTPLARLLGTVYLYMYDFRL